VTTVLIVDDHPAWRLVLKQHLSQLMGVVQILEAGNGQDAIQKVRQARPGLVILDIELPRINGLEAIPRIKAIHPGARILAVSAQDSALFARRVQAAGAQGYVGKVLEVPEIVRAVEAVMAGYTVFPASGGMPRASDAYAIERLSDKELVVMQMLARGMTNKEIGDAMFTSNKTISTYKTRLMAKLGLASLVELVDFARKHHLVVAPQLAD